MTIAAAVSAAELNAQVTNRFVDQHYEARLINAPGTSYQPGITTDATFLADEVVLGTGGYQRQVIKYVNADVGTYADDGVGLATKATVFAHDGSGTTMDFSHAALVKSTGNITLFGSVTGKPTAGVDGTYEALPLITGGVGVGATADLTIQNSGAANGDFILTINSPGYDYAPADLLQIQEAVLVAAGAVAASAGDLSFTVSTVSAHADAGALLAVAETAAAVSLTAGNEAAFYWNIKQYGYYEV